MKQAGYGIWNGMETSKGTIRMSSAMALAGCWQDDVHGCPCSDSQPNYRLKAMCSSKSCSTRIYRPMKSWQSEELRAERELSCGTDIIYTEVHIDIALYPFTS